MYFLTIHTHVVEPGSTAERLEKIKDYLTCTKKPKLYNWLYSNKIHSKESALRYLKFDVSTLDENPVLCGWDFPEIVIDKTGKNWNNNEIIKKAHFVFTDENGNTEECLLIDDGKNYVYPVIVSPASVLGGMEILYMALDPNTGKWFDVTDSYLKKSEIMGKEKETLFLGGVVPGEGTANSSAVSAICRWLCKPFEWMYKLCHTIDSCILCVKYPFLYTRNRMTGRHYTSWKVREKISKLQNRSTVSVSYYTNASENQSCGEYVISSHNELTVKKRPAEHNKEEFVYYVVKSDMKEFVLHDRAGGNYAYVTEKYSDGSAKRWMYVVPKKKGGWMLTQEDETVKTPFWICIDDYQKKETAITVSEEKKHVYLDLYTSMEDRKKIARLEWYEKYILGPLHFIPTSNELDAMDSGWKRAFGIKLCDELKEQLKKEGYLKKYRIVQIKEKFGELRWYDAASSREVMDIINKYTVMSEKICINCGRPARYITSGWICPYCENCISKESIETATELDEHGNVIHNAFNEEEVGEPDKSVEEEINEELTEEETLEQQEIADGSILVNNVKVEEI